MLSRTYRQALGTLQRTLHRIERDLESKTACVATDQQCLQVTHYTDNVHNVILYNICTQITQCM